MASKLLPDFSTSVLYLARYYPTMLNTAQHEPNKETQGLEIFGLGLVILLMFVPVCGMAQGGPPMITDDPDTPGPGYWEINVSGIDETSSSARRLEAPLADINYGVGERIQLKFEIPWLNGRETGSPVQSGIGNSALGVKWRFLGEERKRIAWSIYPQLELNTGHSAARKGLVEEGRQFLFPTELTVRLGKLELNTEIGRNFVQSGKDELLYGISTEAEFHPRFELLGELHGEHRSREPAELIVNIGARLRCTNQIILLMAAGRTVQRPFGEPPFSRFYFGFQFNLPHQYAPPKP